MRIQIVKEEKDSRDADALCEEIARTVAERFPGVICETIEEVARKPLKVRCFGEFEVFDPDRPLEFRRVRTKELFAVLVCHRGSMLSMGEIMSILWEDGVDTDSDKSYLRTMIADLKRTFSTINADNVIIKKYNQIGIDPSLIDCDYYDFLEGKRGAIDAYNGQFMKQYSWAEYELQRV